jgi:hypothetical protein
MAIATIRITLETLDSAGNRTNEPLVREVDLAPRAAGRGPPGISKRVHGVVTGMLDALRFGEAFEPGD